MKLSKNDSKSVRQNGIAANKSQKHDVNLQKNSTLYFQVGLIVCLLVSYGLLELKFEDRKELVFHDPGLTMEDPYFMSQPYEIYKEPEPVKQETKKQKVVRAIDPIVKNTLDPINETKTINPDFDEPKITKTPTSAIKNNSKPVIPALVGYNFVEEVPIFPGCENVISREEKMKCMSEKIGKHIKRKFDTDLAMELGLKGVQRINVMFTIDKYGNVVDVKARSPHDALDNEAKEVMAKLPKMTPGKQNQNPVNVIYTFPIVFQVQ